MQTSDPAPTVARPLTAAPGPPRVPVVRGLQTGGPAHRATQDEVKEAATTQFPDVVRSEAMLGVFDNAEITSRRFARPLEWYLEPRTFAQKNAVYVEEALALSERVARAAMEQAGVEAGRVDAIVFVSSTGLSTPSLDAHLVDRLGLAPTVARLPLWGLGCAGGAGGLARGADLVRAGFEHVLVIAVEFCSLTFVLGDEAKSNFIGTALFGDGAAALVLGADTGPDDGGLVRLGPAHSALIPHSADLTGWDITEAGFTLRLSPEIPAMMMEHLRPIVEASLAADATQLADLKALVVHPGGAKVIAGYQAALGLDEQLLDPARTVLREHGNMSSPTVLFVLEEALRRQPAPGPGLISATGPGFSAEHLLVEFV